ncbi:hypothetical protein D7V86_14490 [bacterium D16-51]|nr:hypothetical protein D7V96_23860 [bacterium D16-59]RKI58912.1 hypothetical protein D7V86_14490 [bacterium D16-51]
MYKKKGVLMGSEEIQWHPPYVAAMNLELGEDRDKLVFIPEYTLNTGALKIDLFMENKGHGSVRNDIGKIFRRYNIVEFKSPDDMLGIDVFIKVQGYACLFKAYGEKADGRKMEEITVSLIRWTKPDKLFGYFKEHGVEVENPCKGIYYIREMVLFPTQIIVTKELDSEKHRWLCALSGQLAEQDLRGLLTSISCLEGKMEKEYADSVLEVALRANRGLAEKLRRDDNMSKTLMEIMEPVLAEVRQECMREGLKEGRREGRREGMVYAYYEMNLSTNEIAQKLQLTEEEVLEIIRKKDGQL